MYPGPCVCDKFRWDHDCKVRFPHPARGSENINVELGIIMVVVWKNSWTFYQTDNLRLSNELFEVSKKLEDHKIQINKFENNKSQIQEQIYNLNKIISKNNIVKNHFDLFSQNKDVQNIPKIT